MVRGKGIRRRDEMRKSRLAAASLTACAIAGAFYAAGCFTTKATKKEWIDPMKETKEQRDARMGWWRDAKFGMFIHWGVYAVPAGRYHGKEVRGIGEWIMNRAKIPVAEYKSYAKKFNPVKYDPDAWVRLAKEAGMKYIVITSKHHDGFALFDSKVTDWDVVDATPYGKDLLKPLEKACEKYGMKLGFYYSQAQDWNHPGGAKAGYKEGDGWDDAQKGSFDEYIDKIAIPQVKELFTNYDIDILWWDTPVWMNKDRAARLYKLLKLKPGLITNNRLGGGFKGDLLTPEQHIPATGLHYDWETCMTMNNTWGYKVDDNNWKSVEALVRNLIDIASKGGNFLLNVGPTAEGEIPQPSIERLKAIGKWMKVNGDAIYGTKASPFRKLPWGRCTRKEGKLYLHVFDWPKTGVLVVPGLRNEVVSAKLLATGKELKFERDGGNVVVRVSGKALDPIATVIELEIKGEPDVDPLYPTNAADGSITLRPKDAYLEQHGYSSKLFLSTEAGSECVRNWRVDKAAVSWDFDNKRSGKYAVSLDIFSKEEQSRDMSLVLYLDGKKIADGGLDDIKMNKWNKIDFGVVEIPKGVHSIRVRRFSAERRKRRKARQRVWGEIMVGDFSFVPASK